MRYVRRVAVDRKCQLVGGDQRHRFGGDVHPRGRSAIGVAHDGKDGVCKACARGLTGAATVAAGSNGTSGTSVETEVLQPTGRTLDDAWITDAIDTFYVKHGTSSRREQGDAISQIYAPFAQAVGLPACTLPARPSPA